MSVRILWLRGARRRRDGTYFVHAFAAPDPALVDPDDAGLPYEESICGAVAQAGGLPHPEDPRCRKCQREVFPAEREGLSL